MAKEIDIWWEDGGRLKASMRWTNKKGRISFTLIPSGTASCVRCPFKGYPICNRNRVKKTDERFCGPGLCSLLWSMEGDNQFEGRDKIIGWQPIGPLGREKKKK